MMELVARYTLPIPLVMFTGASSVSLYPVIMRSTISEGEKEEALTR
jgi:hypothetical protein